MCPEHPWPKQTTLRVSLHFLWQLSCQLLHLWKCAEIEGLVSGTNLPAKLLKPTDRTRQSPLSGGHLPHDCQVSGGFSWTPLHLTRPTAAPSIPHGHKGPQSDPAPLSSVCCVPFMKKPLPAYLSLLNICACKLLLQRDSKCLPCMSPHRGT